MFAQLAIYIGDLVNGSGCHVVDKYISVTYCGFDLFKFVKLLILI